MMRNTIRKTRIAQRIWNQIEQSLIDFWNQFQLAIITCSSFHWIYIGSLNLPWTLQPLKWRIAQCLHSKSRSKRQTRSGPPDPWNRLEKNYITFQSLRSEYLTSITVNMNAHFQSFDRSLCASCWQFWSCFLGLTRRPRRRGLLQV